jgi:hypothetical protein
MPGAMTADMSTRTLLDDGLVSGRGSAKTWDRLDPFVAIDTIV